MREIVFVMTDHQGLSITIYLAGRLSRDEQRENLRSLFSKAFTNLVNLGLTITEARTLLSQADEQRLQLTSGKLSNKPIAFYIGSNYCKTVELPWINTSWVSIDQSVNRSSVKDPVDLPLLTLAESSLLHPLKSSVPIAA